MSNQRIVPIYTIGYGGRAQQEFFELLQRYEVKYLIDVRSVPHSRFRPEFDRRALDAALAGFAGGEIRYIFLGDALGGRPADDDCYTDGRVDYERVKEKEFFRQGLRRLEKAYEQEQCVALMCSEAKPYDCHRSKLIGASLDALSIPVMHIDEEGKLQSQSEVMARVTGGQMHLFGAPMLGSRKKYAPGNPPEKPDDERGIEER